MNKRRIVLLASCVLLPLIALATYAAVTRINPNNQHAVGDQLDELNGVAIYYNGGVNTVQGRNLSKDGYNLGLRYQCVEFVKRYYFERHDHRMPDSYGHAKDFFDPTLSDGSLNTKRAMLQFRNGSAAQPQAEDLLVFAPTLFNRYGHVAIIASVGGDTLEIAQQNPGPFGRSREDLPLTQREGRWYIGQDNVLGWLRLTPADAMLAPELSDSRNQ
ncbi:CHAP domain-containing protein [Pseudomonas sp.]|jgi:ABC-type multidrug transport system fused ATPase/permease subunit|uniref:CHAP domain-containing protein n=1 Tax=Pseudomonas sp. TaxID=306 RepID=UPI0037C50038